MDDPYATLEVSPEASADEIKRAYRRLARRWHPDRNPDDPQAEARFKQVAQAWEALSRPDRRRGVDLRRAATQGFSAGGPPGGVPEALLEAIANAVERGQRWAEEVVVPHYASMHRGRGAEMAVRWAADIDADRVSPGRFEARPTLSGRWRARRWLRRAVVAWGHDRHRTVVVLVDRGGFVIRVSPAALWAAGFGADTTELDDAVLRLLVSGYAAALCQLPGGFDGAGDAATAWARGIDDRAVRNDRVWKAVIVAVASAIGFMWLAAARGW